MRVSTHAAWGPNDDHGLELYLAPESRDKPAPNPPKSCCALCLPKMASWGNSEGSAASPPAPPESPSSARSCASLMSCAASMRGSALGSLLFARLTPTASLQYAKKHWRSTGSRSAPAGAAGAAAAVAARGHAQHLQGQQQQ